MGISEKNMIILPNNVLGDIVNSHKTLYPNDKILSVFPKDFTPKNRNKILEEIKMYEYDDKCKCILIGGDGCQGGNDPGEVIIRNAIVLA